MGCYCQLNLIKNILINCKRAEIKENTNKIIKLYTKNVNKT